MRQCLYDANRLAVQCKRLLNLLQIAECIKARIISPGIPRLIHQNRISTVIQCKQYRVQIRLVKLRSWIKRFLRYLPECRPDDVQFYPVAEGGSDHGGYHQIRGCVADYSQFEWN